MSNREKEGEKEGERRRSGCDEETIKKEREAPQGV
jgi:hypothetical protein